MARAGQSRPMTTIQCGGVAGVTLGLIHLMLITMQRTLPIKKPTKDNFTHGLIWQIILQLNLGAEKLLGVS
jgi:hypothetical protein